MSSLFFSWSLPEAVPSCPTEPTDLVAGRRLLLAISSATAFHNLIPRQKRTKLRPQSCSLGAKRRFLTALTMSSLFFSWSLPEAVPSCPTDPTDLVAGRRLLLAISSATAFHNLIPRQKRTKLRPQSCSLGAKRRFLTALTMSSLFFSWSLPEAIHSPPTVKSCPRCHYTQPDAAKFSDALPRHRQGSADIYIYICSTLDL